MPADKLGKLIDIETYRLRRFEEQMRRDTAELEKALAELIAESVRQARGKPDAG